MHNLFYSSLLYPSPISLQKVPLSSNQLKSHLNITVDYSLYDRALRKLVLQKRDPRKSASERKPAVTILGTFLFDFKLIYCEGIYTLNASIWLMNSQQKFYLCQCDYLKTSYTFFLTLKGSLLSQYITNYRKILLKVGTHLKGPWIFQQQELVLRILQAELLYLCQYLKLQIEYVFLSFYFII